MRYCGQIGDTLFIMVSAWFLSDSFKSKAPKVIRIIFDTWMISFIGLLIASLFLDVRISEILHALFPIKYNVNWFVGCYLLYYIIHPLLNKAVDEFGKRELVVLTSTLFIMYSIVSTIEKSYYYTNLVGFISLHYFVMYYKRYVYPRQMNIHAPLVLACATVGIFCWICLLNVLGEYFPLFSDNNLFGCVFMNPLIVFIGIALLDIQTHCKRCNLNHISHITKYSLLVYLIHANHFWLSYGKYFLYEKLNMLGMNILESVCVMVLLYFAGAFAIAIVYDKIFGKLAVWVADKGASVLKRVMGKLGD